MMDLGCDSEGVFHVLEARILNLANTDPEMVQFKQSEMRSHLKNWLTSLTQTA